MEKKLDPKQHEYETSYRNSSEMLVAFSLLLTALGIFYFIASLSVMSADGFNYSKLLRTLWDFILFSIWSPLFLIFIAYLYTDINVNEQGLHFKFLFKNYDVLWDEVLYSKSPKPLGLSMRHSAILVVTNGHLTFIHRIYGLFYGKTSNPSFLISSKISNYPSLTKIISEKVKANRRINKQ